MTSMITKSNIMVKVLRVKVFEKYDYEKLCHFKKYYRCRIHLTLLQLWLTYDNCY